MKAHLREVGFAYLCLLVLVVSAVAPEVARAEETAPAKATGAKTLRLPESPYRYTDGELPAHFSTFAARRFDNTPVDNPITDYGATLGRVLFYDTRMSANNTVACASCHHQKNSFVDPNRQSKGFDGQLTDRHAPSLVNLRYNPRGRFFWDERAETLEQQVLMPIQSKVEMGQDLDRLTEILTKDKDYPELFRKAFGDQEVTRERIAKALAQFVRSMVSYQSKYDEGLTQAKSVRDDFANFTGEENRGKSLFLRSCASCHLPGGQQAHFVMNRPQNNGLDDDLKNTDGGVGDVTLNPAQMGLFKSPSLRNVEFTAPYMHDGRLATLEDVIEHYSKNVKQHPNLGGRLRRRLNFDDAQKAALVAFLKTLSDVKFLSDPKFADPFVVAAAEPVAKLNDAPANNRNGGRGPGAARRAPTVDEIVERLLAFDKNKDGKISKEELPERMQSLIAKGDVNKDGVLDKDEIQALAVKLRAEGSSGGLVARVVQGLRPVATLERALNDLKLPEPTLEQAGAVIKEHQERVRKASEEARADFFQQTQAFLSPEEFKKFKAAADRSDGSENRGAGSIRALESALDDLKLPGPMQEKAVAVVKAHQEKLRKLSELARADLLQKTQEILSEEEFIKFKDATERLPGLGRRQ